MCYSHLNQPMEGMKYIDAAISLNSFYRGAILQKGMLHLQLDEKEIAKNLFEKALNLSPDDEQMEVYYSIANCYLWLKDYEETIKQVIKEVKEEYISEYFNKKPKEIYSLSTNTQLYMAKKDNKYIKYLSAVNMKLAGSFSDCSAITD